MWVSLFSVLFPIFTGLAFNFFRKVEYMVVIFGILVNDEVLILFASCYSFAPYISSKTISTYVVFNPMD